MGIIFKTGSGYKYKSKGRLQFSIQRALKQSTRRRLALRSLSQSNQKFLKSLGLKLCR